MMLCLIRNIQTFINTRIFTKQTQLSSLNQCPLAYEHTPKNDIIIKYKELMQTLQNELMNYFELNSIKRIVLLNFLKEKLGESYDITNMAFYEKLKNANRWKSNEIIVFEFMHQHKKKRLLSPSGI
jgi:hypothetical protein